MKKEIRITLVCILIAILFCFADNVIGQSKKTLVADETWAIVSNSGALKVITCNDGIFKELNTKFYAQIKTVNASKKKDRKGYYWEYSIAFEKENVNPVIEYLNKIGR